MNPEENNIEKNKPQERIPIKSLRTYQGDVQEAIEKNNYSSTTILVSEQKRKLENPIDPVTVEKYKIRNKNFIFFSVILIVLGIVSISGLYYLKSKEAVEIEQKTKTLIAFTEETNLSLGSVNQQELFSKFSESKTNWSTPVNSVLYVNPTVNGNEISTEDILSLIAPDMPPSLVRSFGEKYMLGIYSFDTNEPFIILTVKDFSLAYPGMLKWEKDMLSNLGNMFSIPTIENASTTNVFTFKDEVIKNRDLRVVKDATGNTLVLYSFIDRKTLIIAKDEDILSAIVGKILINKQTK